MSFMPNLKRRPDSMKTETELSTEFDIAIIGMAGRFPDAPNVGTFWENLCKGKESVRRFSDDELRELGVPEQQIQNPSYVKAAPVLDDVAGFDARFFGFTPNEAVLMDPQHRLALELAWEALEVAGYDSTRLDARVGVYASCAMNTYLLNSGILPKFTESYLPTLIGSDKDFLATRISYRLGLTGPSMTVQTACSSSLVAIHTACQSLLSEECDMALAGGAAIKVPHHVGHVYSEGSVFTPDGHCKPFDSKANGTIFGSGGGMVVLKRAADAVADGDHITAVIKGSAVNNDGNSKAEYTAPSIESQCDVVLEALANANVDPENVAYVETHGTGTFLGDPIEIAALTKAFRQSTDATGFCAVGSVKANIGHLDAAAGVTALIKTAMAIEHKQLPPSINFDTPNPQIEFEKTPFFVNTATTNWQNQDIPQYAGVTSLGIGGTNAHVVLGRGPAVESTDSDSWHLLPISAKSQRALEQSTERVANHLSEKDTESKLDDVAFTLQTGRQGFGHRCFAVARDMESASNVLQSTDPEILRAGVVDGERREIVMMFTGQGSQYVGMARGLYDRFDSFRNELDRCAEILSRHLRHDIRELIFADVSDVEAQTQLKRTEFAQPALFVVEYCLARLLISWGVQPSLLVGHSIGEYVAACIANVFTLEAALKLVTERGRLMQSMPSGLMLSVPLSMSKLDAYVSDNVELGCANSSDYSVLTGAEDAIVELESKLQGIGIDAKIIHTSHAFHSKMMEPILAPFSDHVRNANPKPPEIPVLSNLTGKLLSKEQATSPDYWAQHLRSPVLFNSCLDAALAKENHVLLELGPGRALATFARRHQKKRDQVVLTLMRSSNEQKSDAATLLDSVGRLWLLGIELNWESISDLDCRRVPLPTYPFERQRVWPDELAKPIAAPNKATVKDHENGVDAHHQRLGMSDWFYTPSWKSTAFPVMRSESQGRRKWLAFVDDNTLTSALLDGLSNRGDEVIRVIAGDEFLAKDDGSFVIDPQCESHYERIADACFVDMEQRHAILHSWTLGAWATPLSVSNVDAALERSMYSMMHIARVIGRREFSDSVSVVALSTEAQKVLARDSVRADKAALLGPCKIVPREFSSIECRSVDVEVSDSTECDRTLVDQLLSELSNDSGEPFVAFRGGVRWIESVSKLNLPASVDASSKLRDNGTYLLTGGLGGIGLELALFLANSVQNVRLILLTRRPLPAKHKWKKLIASRDDESLARKLEKVIEIENLGAKVVCKVADVADESSMLEVAGEVSKQFGAVNGIINSAGVIDEAGTIQQRSREAHEATIRSKVHGGLVLMRAFQGDQLDFVAHCSSIATTLYHTRFAQLGYVVANGFLDSLACRADETGPLVVTINWDEWGEVGMAARAQADFNKKHDLKAAVFDKRDQCSPSEGVEAFRRILAVGFSRVIVSPRNLLQRIESDPFDQSPFLKAVENSLASVRVKPSSVKPRAGDANGFREENGIEAVKAVWTEVTGVASIDSHDNFFELGGSSLMATQVMARLREIANVELVVQTIFEYPTVSKLAKHIVGLVAQNDLPEKSNEPDETEELMDGAL